jgi:hypothetical protein
VARAAVSQPQPAGRPVPIVLRIERPDLRVELSLTSGTTGTLRLPDESAFGIRPTRFYSARARFGFGPVIREVVRVEILDLAVSPWKSLGVVDVPAGESVQSATSPAFTITLVDRLAWNRR